MNHAFDTMAAKEKKMNFFNKLTTALVVIIFALSLGVNAFGNILKLAHFHKLNITPELLLLDLFVVLFAILFYREMR